MDKKIAGLLGAAAALATVSGANATEVQGNAQNPAASYRDLLNPVPKALEALKADDARLASAPADEVKLAQVYRRITIITTIIIIHVVPRIILVPPHRHHHITTTITTTAAITATDRGRGQSMIPKSGCRFSEKIMLRQNARAQSIHYEAIAL